MRYSELTLHHHSFNKVDDIHNRLTSPDVTFLWHSWLWHHMTNLCETFCEDDAQVTFSQCSVNVNMEGLFLLLYELLQLWNTNPSMIKKYLGIVGDEVAWECLGGLNLDFVLVVSSLSYLISEIIQNTAWEAIKEWSIASCRHFDTEDKIMRMLRTMVRKRKINGWYCWYARCMYRHGCMQF